MAIFHRNITFFSEDWKHKIDELNFLSWVGHPLIMNSVLICAAIEEHFMVQRLQARSLSLLHTYTGYVCVCARAHYLCTQIYSHT